MDNITKRVLASNYLITGCQNEYEVGTASFERD
jgi:hypothetical protein